MQHFIQVRFFIPLLILFTCSLVNANAQINTYQLSLKDSSLNILYAQYQNHVYVDNLPKGCKLKFNNKLIAAEQPPNSSDGREIGSYFLLPDDKEENILRVFQNGKEIYKKEYIIKHLTFPVVKLGIIKDSFASVSELLAEPMLVWYVPDYYLKSRYRIISYDIELHRNGNFQHMHKDTEKGDFSMVEFDDNIKNEIKLLKPGDKIIVNEVVVLGEGDNGCFLRMKPINITIK